jgi:predicted naringenin-chalcone synthase
LFGNVSSASILFALEQFLQDQQESGLGLMLGLGPGLCLETALFEV